MNKEILCRETAKLLFLLQEHSVFLAGLLNILKTVKALVEYSDVIFLELLA